MSEPTRPIRPELLAAKIEKIENFEQPRLLMEFGQNPRLVKALWFLQWVSQPSNYAGGLSKFSEDLVDASRDRIGTERMVKVGPAERYSTKDAIAIFRELPSDVREELFESNASFFEEAFLHGMHKTRIGFNEYSKDWEPTLVAKMNPAALRSRLCDVARSNLAEYFKQLCELPRVGFISCDPAEGGHGAPWYFVAVAEALLAFIDARAEKLRSSLADTEVTRLVSRWVVKSRNMKRSVMIIGSSRFGKSEALKLHARIYPGNCRLVDTPTFNAISDLLLEVAKNLGLEVGPANAGRELRERIDYVLRFSRLQIIFDESQRLLPAAYSRNTAPARLNWVRRSIMDQEIAAVFVCTPQSYLPAKRKFVKTTGFAMEQFDERILKTVQLPEELSESDALAVARIHFAGLPEEYLRYVADKVLATERNFVSDIEKIATLAKDNAREHSRNRPALADIEAAISDVLPTVLETVAPASPRKMPSKPVIHPPCKAAAEALPMPRRGLETLNRDRFPRPAEVPA
jgi:hypothetical protein